MQAIAGVNIFCVNVVQSAVIMAIVKMTLVARPIVIKLRRR